MKKMRCVIIYNSQSSKRKERNNELYAILLFYCNPPFQVQIESNDSFYNAVDAPYCNTYNLLYIIHQKYFETVSSVDMLRRSVRGSTLINNNPAIYH